ncbi:hypothetical protein [Paenibacillus montanisoli]|uniref:Uncharacterized protein n=1 Tax=Paenibacillus montanisoli TaxID=2081970 RepID=A0A328U883_9BACL|nr:hypothetical protein [Paenibacillus montanisoli]RAP78292.1 hypothetical protein DL346_07645 [Paenibacillus montanisoli]
MEGNNSTAKCAVQRLGRVVAVVPSGVTIEVEGKVLTLRHDRAEAGVKTGDNLLWNGKLWVVVPNNDEN